MTEQDAPQSVTPCAYCGKRRWRWHHTARRICLAYPLYIEAELCGVCADQQRQDGWFVLTIVPEKLCGESPSSASP